MRAGAAAVEPPVRAPVWVLGLGTPPPGLAGAVGGEADPDALGEADGLAPADGLADGLAAAVPPVRQIRVSWPYLAKTASSITEGWPPPSRWAACCGPIFVMSGT